MWLRRPLDDLLSSRAKTAVIRLLCSVSGPLSVAQVAARGGVARGHASRVLAELATSGLLVSRAHGRIRTYELAAHRSDLVRRLKALFEAEAERCESFADALAREAPGVLSVILFGSEARGEARPGSDTDLLVVVERRTTKAEAELQAVCRHLADRETLALSWQVADLGDLRRWEADDEPLLEEIRADGVVLWGQPLERLRRAWKRGRSG
jgi:predicted nucleotidyltransferase